MMGWGAGRGLVELMPVRWPVGGRCSAATWSPQIQTRDALGGRRCGMLPARSLCTGNLKCVLGACISLGPGVVADNIDEIIADERWVEMLEYISVDGSERAVRAVCHRVVERPQDPVFEIWSWVGVNDGVKRLRGQRLTVDTQHVGLH